MKMNIIFKFLTTYTLSVNQLAEKIKREKHLGN